MIQSNSSFNELNQTLYALKWIHGLVNSKDPCRYPMVMATVESARRLLSKPVQKKEPITPHHPLKLAKKFGGPQTSLLNQFARLVLLVSSVTVN